ncbi:2,4-dichlorophenol 6-monooxygenase [Fusarium culmorum]|uniref:2,4-dichlorophenol 6-monooxygenase n=1 Tax=Fusarium culmorum TaxID=5516 RepID=A0A2T4H937_FUSCU|nr:2,4-dichlorophenol 6-monooxygenase [Fusarium culmorum]
MTTPTDLPVLIIGAGPSGATLAMLLARQGVKSLAISKHRGSANTPRAHIFNQRAMEVLRDARLEDVLRDIATPVTDMQHTSWLSKLSGEEYGRLWAWGNKPEQKGDYEASSPCVMSDIPQSVLEPILVDQAGKIGAEFRFFTEFVRFEQCPDGVKTTLKDRESGKEYIVTSQYLIGADGARSLVMGQLGIPIIGKQINSAFNVHIRADLTKYIAHRPGSLNWVLNTEAPDWSAVGNFRMVKPWTEFVVSMHPATKDPNSFQPTKETLLERLYQMVGTRDVEIEILSYFSWSINDQVAERWQDGRVLCIGDATHRHPPINGLGSNTCLSDAFNLAWKLAYVIQDKAAPELLDTLTPERKPVGDAIVRRANDGMEAHRKLWAVLGLDAESRHQATALLESASPEGVEKRAALRDAIEGTEDEVQALGIQMNQVYANSGSRALVIEPGDEEPDFSGINNIRQVKVTTYPGYHLPHVWVAADSLSQRISTLDLAGRGDFVLFTGIGGDKWISAAKDITSRGSLTVRGYSIGFHCHYMDCYRDWAKNYEELQEFALLGCAGCTILHEAWAWCIPDDELCTKALIAFNIDKSKMYFHLFTDYVFDVDIFTLPGAQDCVQLVYATNVRYVCLSHCWGGTRSKYLTTRENISANESRIPLLELPKTFQDAFYITKALGIRYLWIDTFCIIQEDEKDWETQASLMAAIYENTYITIAAGASDDDDGGFFSEPGEGYTKPHKFHLSIDGIDHELYVRNAVPHPERLLAKGYLCFGHNEIFWECQEDVSCSCTIADGPFNPCDGKPKFRGCEPLKYQCSLLNNLSSSELGILWRDLVEEYSGRDLTKPSDKLPALAGLAEKFQRVLKSPFLAGLWEKNLRADLAWHTSGNDASFGRVRKGPSWTWAAACESRIRWPSIQLHKTFQVNRTSIHGGSQGFKLHDYAEGSHLSIHGLIHHVSIQINDKTDDLEEACPLLRRCQVVEWIRNHSEHSQQLVRGPGSLVESLEQEPRDEATEVDGNEKQTNYGTVYADYRFWEKEEDLRETLKHIYFLLLGTENDTGPLWIDGMIIKPRRDRGMSLRSVTKELVGFGTVL